MYEQAFKNIDDTLWKDAGCSSELDYLDEAFDGETISFLCFSLIAK